MKSFLKASFEVQVPIHHNKWVHMFVPSIIGLGISIVSLMQIENLRCYQLVVAPIMLFALFGFEWIANKYFLHRKTQIFRELFDLHERAHHVLFSHKEMIMKESWENYYVMMPPYAIILMLCFMSPVVLGFGVLFGTNIACILLITGMLSFLTYEWMHWIYHQSWAQNYKAIRYLMQFHKTHHNPSNMNKYNFNVVLPVFDLILKTFK